MNDIDRLAQLPVCADADAARLVSEATRMDLMEKIMTTASRGAVAGRGPAASRRRPDRRWLIGVPVAAALGVGLFVASLGSPGDRVGPLGTGIAKAALAFTRHGRYIDVLVRDPVADPARYRAEFKAHGLDITLKLIPVSPSLVGTIVYFDGGSAIKPITAKDRCFTGGGGDVCPVGVRVPIDFRGQASLVFGRAARPGERYESTTSATAPGEVLHGLKISGRTVAAVLKMLKTRNVTAPVFHVTTAHGIGEIWPASRVPASWYVYNADPWAPGQVLLWVSRTHSPPQSAPPSPRTPMPSPGPPR
jgi:hypothetical protein